MKIQTEYSLRKKLKRLQNELDSLYIYKSISMEIFDAISTNVHEGNRISQGWILKQFRRALR